MVILARDAAKRTVLLARSSLSRSISAMSLPQMVRRYPGPGRRPAEKFAVGTTMPQAGSAVMVLVSFEVEHRRLRRV